MIDEYLLVATVWFGVGVFFATLYFLAKNNRYHFKLIKKIDELTERNEELIEQNLRVISFNNEVVAELNECKKMFEKIEELLR